ncbi:MAG TPA: pitrilysin family protein [Puia sp.]|nr:pitrilysin family protein [Puia sp.]
MLNRTIAPKITDATGFTLTLPPFEKHRLRNGVDIFMLNLGELDTLMINWVFDAGNFYEEKNLVAGAANYLLKNGTTSKSAYAINEHFEYYGSYLSRSCQNEFADVTLHCLGKHVHELLPVVAEIFTVSVFPQEELDIFKKNMQQRLLVGLKKSDFVAGRMIDAYLFGEKHPYGRMSSVEDYESLHRDEIAEFFDRYYHQGRCVIFVAGKIPTGLIQQMEREFGSLPMLAHVEAAVKHHHIIHAKEKKYRINNDPNGVQGSIRIARNFPNRHHPDFQKMQVLNNLFGGFFGSRLMSNIREEKGYTYGIHSYLMNHVEQSAFLITTEAGKEVCEATIEEVYKEMAILREDPVDEEELSTTRNFMIGVILGDLDGPFQVASRWKNIVLNNLDANYFYRSIDIIKTISSAELQDLASKYFRPEEFYELVVV